MNKVIRLFLFSGILLAACAPKPTVLPTFPATQTATLTLTATPSQTRTPPPTNPPPATATLIPTDAGLGLLPKPQPAVCPQESAEVAANFAPDATVSIGALLDYLNAGGSTKIFQNSPKLLGPGKVIDLTGDGVNEIILKSAENHYHFFECKDSKYQLQAFHFEGSESDSVQLKDMLDLNQNGLPELIFAINARSNQEIRFSIYEWDGGLTYRSLIRLQEDWVGTTGNYRLQDTNGDGLREVIVINDVRSLLKYMNLQFVNETITLGWDGKNYINLTPRNFDRTDYLVSIAAFGDQEVLYRNYPKAIAYYQRLISDKTLKWSDITPFTDQKPTATPIPRADQYALFAAYAHYRLMILYVYTGNMDLAAVNYNALQEKFPTGIGHPYVQLATVFWDAYQSYLYHPEDTVDNVESACFEAIQYTEKHEYEILWLFNRSFILKNYYPQDICPFK